MKKFLVPFGYALSGTGLFFIPLSLVTFIWVIALADTLVQYGATAVSSGTWKEAFLLKAVWLFAGVRGERIRRDGCQTES
ncbi:MAG: hypothetical protein AMXMBFR44_1280 [Candidatus Campbellbacteria bacterium]